MLEESYWLRERTKKNQVALQATFDRSNQLHEGKVWGNIDLVGSPAGL
jgi:hypothetical protein